MLLGRLQKNEAPSSRQGVSSALAQNQNSRILASFCLERPSKTIEFNLCPIPTLSPSPEQRVPPSAIPWTPPEVVTVPLEGQPLPTPDNPFYEEIPGNSFPWRNSWNFLSMEKFLVILFHGKAAGDSSDTQARQPAQSPCKGTQVFGLEGQVAKPRDTERVFKKKKNYKMTKCISLTPVKPHWAEISSKERYLPFQYSNMFYLSPTS